VSAFDIARCPLKAEANIQEFDVTKKKTPGHCLGFLCSVTGF
jgi:hypothetical protein